LTQVNAKYQSELKVLAGEGISPQSPQRTQSNIMAQN
jgi:hypothetical protein